MEAVKACVTFDRLKAYMYTGKKATGRLLLIIVSN